MHRSACGIDRLEEKAEGEVTQPVLRDARRDGGEEGAEDVEADSHVEVLGHVVLVLRQAVLEVAVRQP